MNINIDFDTEKFGKGTIDINVPLALFELLQQPAFLQADMIGVLARAIMASNGKKDDDIHDLCESKTRFYRGNVDDLVEKL
jgi:hypothetical protein